MKTVVHCSVPNCDGRATAKIAAPWVYGSFRELKTYGYACPDHPDQVVDYAKGRLRPRHLDPGEALGEVEAYEI